MGHHGRVAGRLRGSSAAMNSSTASAMSFRFTLAKVDIWLDGFRPLLCQGCVSNARFADFLRKNGSAGAGKTRTSWDLCLTISIPFSRWGAKPFVIHPFPFPPRMLEDLSPATEERSQAQEPRMHPFLLAQSWRQEMEQDAKLNKARIAAREGIS